jgi:hypothetical protein
MSLINSSRIESFSSRLDALHPDTQPHFGKLTSLRLLDHLIASLEIAMGHRQDKAIFPEALARLLRPLMHLPMLRRMPTTQAFLEPARGDFQQRLNQLQELLRLFHREVLTNPVQKHLHPVFGSMNRMQWAKLQDRHFEHHFRQFGL